MAFHQLFCNILMVVWRVIHIENTVIAMGNKISANQPVPVNDMVDINPIRAECAADIISSNTGAAAKKPIPAAWMQILPTIICIWRAINVSDAPIWFNISSSRRCSIAVLRAMYEMHTLIAPNISNSINDDIVIIHQPAPVDAPKADACVKKRAFLDSSWPTDSRSSVVLN